MSEKTKSHPVKRVDVILKTAHTHAGKERAKGDKINVTTDQATWLKDRKII